MPDVVVRDRGIVEGRLGVRLTEFLRDDVVRG